MNAQDRPSLRYLSADDVLAALPDVATRIALARRTLVGLVADAELPPKIAVHPRPEASFAHAMPALLRGAAEDGSEDLLGMKWVLGFGTNVDQGLPAIHGSVLLNDARTGVPRAILDAAPITAHRTAAVSGAAIERFGPRVAGGAARVALVGAGAQGHSHLPVLAHLLPGSVLVVADRSLERATVLAEAASGLGFRAIEVVVDATRAIEGADLVVTAVSFGPHRQQVPAEAFGPGATVVAVDYDMCVPATVARLAAETGAFFVDDRGQYLFTRTGEVFAGYPDPPPGAMLGEATLADTSRPAGRVLVTHLGVGLADLVFGDAILRWAEQAALGVTLDALPG